MAKSKKPCPGCGEPHYNRDRDKVCIHCQTVLDNYKTTMAARELRPFTLPWAAHEMPHFRHGDKVREILFDFLRAAGPITQEDGERFFERCSVGINPESVGLLPEAGALVGQLYQAIMDACKESYREGRADGENLIANLASGHVSLDDLNRRSIGGAR